MAAAEPDVIEAARLAAAQTLPAECVDDFQRLSRSLVYGPAFQWLLVEAPDENLRRQVIAAIETVLRAAKLRSATLPLARRVADVAILEERLVRHAGRSAVVHVLVARGWFDAARWDAFNVRRERIAAQARARLVFWLDAQAIEAASRAAPDLWAWRAGVYRFATKSKEISPPIDIQVSWAQLELPDTARLANRATHRLFADLPTRPTGPETRSLDEKQLRVAAIRAWLATTPPVEMRGGPLHELGQLLFDIGDYDAALAHWRDVELPHFQSLHDARGAAVVSGQIAEVLRARGLSDEALRIRREEQLPVFERLGDEHSCTVVQGKIADILQDRGEFVEALRMRREQLAVFERLSDARLQTITQGKIASILLDSGHFDEALRIFQEEQLPAYERLGDVRERAVVMGNIADILQARGELDEALRILKEEQLPVFERLGDARAKAVTNAKIGMILLSREPHGRSTAEPLLQQALVDLRRLSQRDADTLLGLMNRHGIVAAES